MHKKRVLLVHNYYQIGGGEHTVFQNEKEMLERHGHSVSTYTRSNDELKCNKLKLLLLPFSTIWSFRSYWDARRQIRENQIDVVHCHNTFPLISPSVYYAARSLRVPVVQTVHNFRFLCPNGLFFCNGQVCEKCRVNGNFRQAMKNGCYRDSCIQTAVAVAMLKVHRWLGTYRKINYIFLTDFSRKKFEGFLDVEAENVFIKPNFVTRPEVSSFDRFQKKFIYAGRLDENKGIRFLVKAWEALPRDCELHIYGDGPLRELCEEAAKKSDNIRLFGFRPQQEILDDLSDAAALVFPSIWFETFGMTLAESFSLGRPVLAADLGNHGSLVRESGGGVVYAVGDEAAFCRGVRELLENNAVYSRKAQECYENYLNEESNYEQLRRIYDEAKHIEI